LLLYYITDRKHFAATEPERRERLLERIADAARCGIDFIQLREKDLCGRDLESLARDAVPTTRASGRSRLLINSRIDIALAIGADGVHLPSKDISARDARRIWRLAGRENEPVITVACHTMQDVIAAKNDGADFAVFAPVFEKKDAFGRHAAGLEQLRTACRHGIPAFALGGITIKNASACVLAGAAGVAGIRLFQEGELSSSVRSLRANGR
jgi:thiamine-phosphate pyrophosphorylase